jgi:protein TonB
LSISLALHAMLLWQLSLAVADRLAQGTPVARTNFLNANLHMRNEPLPASPQQPVIALNRARAQHAMQKNQTASAREAPASMQGPATAAAQVATSQANAMTAAIPSSTSATLDAEGLRQYRVSLAVAARRLRNYPAQALANGWQGSVEIRLTIAPSGLAQPAQLLRGSGHTMIDVAALDMINGAAQSIEVPLTLRSRAFTMDMPIDFSIDMASGK